MHAYVSKSSFCALQKPVPEILFRSFVDIENEVRKFSEIFLVVNSRIISIYFALRIVCLAWCCVESSPRILFSAKYVFLHNMKCNKIFFCFNIFYFAATGKEMSINLSDSCRFVKYSLHSGDASKCCCLRNLLFKKLFSLMFSHKQSLCVTD